MKAIHIYQKERINYDIKIVLNPSVVALPFYFVKWTNACHIQILFFGITIDWLPLRF